MRKVILIKAGVFMNSSDRRAEILEVLKNSDKPIKGSSLAKELDVSRQVIVQDVALLRAQGEDIMATPQGYILPKLENIRKVRKTVVSKHQGYDAMREELQIMIDFGARILDVIVEHPIYGEIKGLLDIGHKQELELFLESIETQKAEPLSSLTEGVHIHTIEINSEEDFQKMKKLLKQKGYLISED